MMKFKAQEQRSHGVEDVNGNKAETGAAEPK